MYEEIKSGKYDNPMMYPKRSDFNTCECGSVYHNQSYCGNCGTQVNFEWEENFKTARKMYRMGDTLARKRFKENAMSYAGIPSTYPKYNEVWSKAWEDGHSNGLWEVVLELEDLVDLLVL